MTELPAGGKGLIREAVLARKSVIAVMARDSAVSIDLLDTFANGRAELPADNLDLVVEFIWHGHIKYNVEADALQPAQQPVPRSVGVLPQLTMKLPKYHYGANQRGGPQPEVKAPPKPKRAGWIGGWG